MPIPRRWHPGRALWWCAWRRPGLLLTTAAAGMLLVGIMLTDMIVAVAAGWNRNTLFSPVWGVGLMGWDGGVTVKWNRGQTSIPWLGGGSSLVVPLAWFGWTLLTSAIVLVHRAGWRARGRVGRWVLAGALAWPVALVVMAGLFVVLHVTGLWQRYLLGPAGLMHHGYSWRDIDQAPLWASLFAVWLAIAFVIRRQRRRTRRHPVTLIGWLGLAHFPLAAIVVAGTAFYGWLPDFFIVAATLWLLAFVVVVFPRTRRRYHFALLLGWGLLAGGALLLAMIVGLEFRLSWPRINPFTAGHNAWLMAVSVMLWTNMVALGLMVQPPAIRRLARWRQAARVDWLSCHQCGYDLRGSIAGGGEMCPECGAAIGAEQRRRVMKMLAGTERALERLG